MTDQTKDNRPTSPSPAPAEADEQPDTPTVIGLGGSPSPANSNGSGAEEAAAAPTEYPLEGPETGEVKANAARQATPQLTAEQQAVLIEAGVLIDNMIKGFAARFPGLPAQTVMSIFAMQTGGCFAHYLETLNGTLTAKVNVKTMVRKSFTDAIDRANLLKSGGGTMPIMDPAGPASPLRRH